MAWCLEGASCRPKPKAFDQGRVTTSVFRFYVEYLASPLPVREYPSVRDHRDFFSAPTHIKVDSHYRFRSGI